MKIGKKIASLVLALVLTVTMSLPVFATSVTVTTPDDLSAHSFVAYQIFKGDYAKDGEDEILSNVEWGSDIVANDSSYDLSANVLAGVASTTEYYGSGQKNPFYGCTTAEDLAKVLDEQKSIRGETFFTACAGGFYRVITNYNSNLESGTTGITGTALSNGGTVDLDPGYYIIVDVTENSTTNPILLEVVGDENISITKKIDEPTVTKQVLEDSTDTYGDAADYSGGEDVSFRLYSEIKNSTLNYFRKYKFVFHDLLSDYFTLNTDSIKVYVAEDANGTNKQEITNQTDVVTIDATSSSSQTFSVTLYDMLTLSKDDNGNALPIANGTGENGKLEGYLLVEYTAKLNTDAALGQGASTVNGVTTYAANRNEAWGEYSSNDSDITGNTTATTTHDQVVVFTYQIDGSKVASDDATKKLADAQFVLYRDGEDTTQEYAILDSATNSVTGWTTDSAQASTINSGSDGSFNVKELDAGTYYLEETKAPSGYNLLKSPITVSITSTLNTTWVDGNAYELLTALSATVAGEETTTDVTGGSVDVIIANAQGSVLPETGGLGTTLLCFGGGLVVLLGGIILVTRKRMSL